MHMRNYGDHLLDAVDEAMQVGERSGCRVQASHLAVVGRRNWGNITAALERMDWARNNGVRARADIYPYLAGSANLSQLLPGWAHEGGTQRWCNASETPLLANASAPSGSPRSCSNGMKSSSVGSAPAATPQSSANRSRRSPRSAIRSQTR